MDWDERSIRSSKDDKSRQAGRCCGHASPKPDFTRSQESGESRDEKHLGTLVDRCIVSWTCQYMIRLTPPS